jgi:Oxidoreductase molybdopterin binding domain
MLSAAGAGSILLAGCDGLSSAPDFQEFLSSAEGLTYRAQRLLGSSHTAAREFGPADISPVFKVNGTETPDSEEYSALRENNFADWRLHVEGLVVKPLELSLADVHALPQRTQITRHDCVEGWSAIGKWRGVPLAFVLTKSMPSIRKLFWPIVSTMRPFPLAMARRCGYASNASLAISRRNTSCVLKSWSVSMELAATRGDFGKTAAMSGMRGFE